MAELAPYPAKDGVEVFMLKAEAELVNPHAKPALAKLVGDVGTLAAQLLYDE